MSDGGRALESDDPRQRALTARIGSVIAGKYRIDALLGEGAMGTVWTATHLNLGQCVALKLIAPEFANFKDARRRFEAEAKAAARIRSRFAVQIQDSGIAEDGSPYLVMEYLTGETLEQRVEREGPLPVEQALRIISQVARGLSRAHALGIVHRDLKPENVFLAQTDDGEEVAKILDFGIAKIQDGPAQSATATGAVLGTPLFMSPEQARGLKTLDHRSDLYSLGMVAYRALTGQHAFNAEAFGELLLAICTRPLPHLHVVAPWLPPALDSWFQRACAREAADRFESAQALVDALLAAAGVTAAELNALAPVTGGRHSAMLSAPEFDPAQPPAALVAGEPSVGGTFPVPLVVPAHSRERVGVGTTGALTRPSEQVQIPKRSLAPVLLGVLLVAAGGAFVLAVASGRLLGQGDSSEPSVASSAHELASADPAPTTPQPSGEPAPSAQPLASGSAAAVPSVSPSSADAPARPGAKLGAEAPAPRARAATASGGPVSAGAERSDRTAAPGPKAPPPPAAPPQPPPAAQPVSPPPPPPAANEKPRGPESPIDMGF